MPVMHLGGKIVGLNQSQFEDERTAKLHKLLAARCAHHRAQAEKGGADAAWHTGFADGLKEAAAALVMAQGELV